jgi:hypothetical protein
VTSARARTLSNRWIIVGITAFVTRTVLAAVGIDELNLPISVGMWLAFIYAISHRQWAHGYEAHAKIREDA